MQKARQFITNTAVESNQVPEWSNTSIHDLSKEYDAFLKDRVIPSSSDEENDDNEEEEDDQCFLQTTDSSLESINNKNVNEQTIIKTYS